MSKIELNKTNNVMYFLIFSNVIVQTSENFLISSSIPFQWYQIWNQTWLPGYGWYPRPWRLHSSKDTETSSGRGMCKPFLHGGFDVYRYCWGIFELIWTHELYFTAVWINFLWPSFFYYLCGWWKILNNIVVWQ